MADTTLICAMRVARACLDDHDEREYLASRGNRGFRPNRSASPGYQHDIRDPRVVECVSHAERSEPVARSRAVPNT